MQPDDLLYTSTHEWVRLDGDLSTIGITDYAQSELGDIVYLELPQVGATVSKDGVFGALESVKTVADLVAPLSGTIVEVNEELPETPELINDDPYRSGWMVIIRLEDICELEDLMTAEQYRQFIRQY